MNRHFSKENTEMVNKHIKRYLTFLASREMQTRDIESFEGPAFLTPKPPDTHRPEPGKEVTSRIERGPGLLLRVLTGRGRRGRDRERWRGQKCQAGKRLPRGLFQAMGRNRHSRGLPRASCTLCPLLSFLQYVLKRWL